MLNVGSLSLQETLAALWDVTTLGVCLIDEAGVILKMNDAAARLLNVQSKQLLGRRFTKLLPAEQDGELLRAHQSYLDEGTPHPLLRANDRLSVTLIKGDLYENCRCVLAVFASRSECARDDYWSRLALENIGEAIIVTDREGRVWFMNERAEALTKLAKGSGLGERLEVVLTLLDRETELPCMVPLERVLQGEQFSSGLTHLVRDRQGNTFPVSEFVTPWYDALGRIKGVIVAFREHRYALRPPTCGRVQDGGGASTLLQTLPRVKRDGLLTLSDGARDYNFFFQEGSLVYFEHGEVDDATALLQVAKLEEGLFTFDSAVYPTRRTLNADAVTFLHDTQSEVGEAKRPRGLQDKSRQGLVVLPDVSAALNYISGLTLSETLVDKVEQREDGSERLVLENSHLKIIVEQGWLDHAAWEQVRPW
jgi:PAS domain S-box-containing protein